MLILSVFRRKQYSLPLWKSIVIPFLLTIFGVTGTMILFFIETGRFGGISFYGSVLLIPVLLIPTAWLLRVPYGKITDYAVPQICIMLSVMKVSCFITGCCGGIALYTSPAGDIVHFPSQIVELVVSLLICALILYLDKRRVLENRLYGVYFLVYGILRFGLNFLRDGIKPFVWIVPAGHFWSLISIGLGIAWILLYNRKMKKAIVTEESNIDV